VSENPEIKVQTQEGIPQEGQNNIFTEMSKYNVMAVQEHIYDVLPRVFIDGYSLSKIALTDQFVNCGKYKSRSGLTFEGCTFYNNDSLTETRGIYYILDAPIYYFSSRRKISRDENEMQQIILNHVRQHLKMNKRLLVSYNNYSISVFDRFVKGRVVKFPISTQQGHLFVLWVPRVPTELPYEKVNRIEVYNHQMEFESEVIRFKINVLAGQAELVYNDTDTHIRGTIKSPDHEQKEVVLSHGSFYLITHQKPIQRRNID